MTQARFALLASGANFSCEVLAALQAEKYLPSLLILPEYPPARLPPGREFPLSGSNFQSRILSQSAHIPIGYAPAKEQDSCAALIREQAIEFLLVACWPYLIGDKLLSSASKAALNLHPSLLPLYRGPDPISAQMAAADSCFGVSLHRLNRHFDRGDIIAQQELEQLETGAGRSQLETDCARLGVGLFIQAVKSYSEGWNPVQQKP